MTAELHSVRADPGIFPLSLPGDSVGTSDGMRTDLPGGQDFGWIGADITTMTQFNPPVPRRKGRRSPGSSIFTEPSEVTVFPIALDTTGDAGDGIAALAIAAKMGSEATFLQAAHEIDWLQHPAADFAQAVRLALAAGAHLFARNLAAEGARLYPDHSELQKMARILAPPRIVRTHVPPDPSVRANAEWLRTHVNEYKGQWVALRDGSMVAFAPTARELKECLDSTEGLMVTRVF